MPDRPNTPVSGGEFRFVSTPSQSTAQHPVNHRQCTTHLDRLPPNAPDYPRGSFAQDPLAPFSPRESLAQWAEWAPSAGDAGRHSSRLGQNTFDDSPALDVYQSDPMTLWQPKLDSKPSINTTHFHEYEPQAKSSYTAFAAFLHPASPRSGPSAPQSSHEHNHSQPESAAHPPAVSPRTQPVLLPRASHPPFVDQFHQSQAYGGARNSHARPASQPFTGSYSQPMSPSRPQTNYHIDSLRWASLPTFAPSLPCDWQAVYARSVTEQPVRAQSTSHMPLTTDAPFGCTTIQLDAPLILDGFPVRGLTLGESARERPGNSSSDGGMSEWGPELIPADKWQNQGLSHAVFIPNGMVAGWFDDDRPFAHVGEPAGPSAVRHPSPAPGPMLESLQLSPTDSPRSRGLFRLSKPKVAAPTGLSAYDPQAHPAAGRKLSKPPRNPYSRRHPCPLCVETPKAFARPSALKTHMLTHTNEKRKAFA